MKEINTVINIFSVSEDNYLHKMHKGINEIITHTNNELIKFSGYKVNKPRVKYISYNLNNIQKMK